MEVLHEFHACDGVRLPFDVACAVLDRHRHAILEKATSSMAGRAEVSGGLGWPSAAPRVVTAPLERDGERWATMAMHWIQPDPAEEAEGGLAAWLHAHLRLLPRPAGGEPITELLLTARCEIAPPEPDGFSGEFCVGFLQVVAAELERRAESERVLQR